MGYRFVAIAIENGGLLSDTTLGLLDELTNRLPTNDRLRFNTFARMKLSATIALGTARLIKERLPIRIGSDGRTSGLSNSQNPFSPVKQAVPYRTGREARYLSVSTE